MITITDWKGNEIKPGMEICLVKIIDRQYMYAGIIFPDGSRLYEDKKPDVECWEIGEYYKVEGEDLIVTIESKNVTLYNPLPSLLKFVNMETHVLAIKGISDKPDNI